MLSIKLDSIYAQLQDTVSFNPFSKNMVQKGITEFSNKEELT